MSEFKHHPDCKQGNDCATGYSDYDSDCAAYDGYERGYQAGLAQAEKLVAKERAAITAQLHAWSAAWTQNQGYGLGRHDAFRVAADHIERGDYVGASGAGVEGDEK